MQLAIIHHHLNRGGVSQVIANHLRSLANLTSSKRPTRVVIIYDGQRNGWPEDPLKGNQAFPIELVELDSIGYDQPEDVADPKQLASELLKVFKQSKLAASDTLLHVHNHSLGKQASLPGALALLAQQGWKQLLQVHDFAEDNRPENYRHLMKALGGEASKGISSELYPQASNLHYATLTTRDAKIFHKAGTAEERLHVIPNPCSGFDSLPSRNEARERIESALKLEPECQLITYPVRGIRRKNVGEMVMLSALAPRNSCFAITLAPNNPAERTSFDRWRQLAADLGLIFRFDTGGEYGVDFLDLIAASDAILTTSVAEGFGMVFLEAWLAGKPLIGRDLVEITNDFRKTGMNYDELYPELKIPINLLDIESVCEDLKQNYQQICQEYQVETLEEGKLTKQLSSLFEGGSIDFGRLPISEQASLIKRVAVDGNARETVHQLNPALITSLKVTSKERQQQIESNAAVVRSVYSEANLANQLYEVYKLVWHSEFNKSVESLPMGSLPQGDSILRHFVTPQTILPVRTES